MLVRALFLLLHLLAATFWVGGMATMHFAVRPAANQSLPPPERLRFMAAALQHFLAWAALAVIVVLVSGMAIVWEEGGFARVHWSVHAMAGIGVLMVLIFGYVRFVAYPRLEKALKLGQPQAAAAKLVVIRHLVALNLALGTVVFGVALLGRVI